jgi:hypothetical protein
MVDIYMLVVECGYVPFFADVLSVYSCILLFFRLKGKCPTLEAIRFEVKCQLISLFAMKEILTSVVFFNRHFRV